MDFVRSDPYNDKNKLVSKKEIESLMENLTITNFYVNDISFYQTSFTHKSYCQLKEYEKYDNNNNCLELQSKSYETMEFLGDSILESVISSYIYQRFHLLYGCDEGFLTRLKIRLVCGQNLYKVSKHLGFQNHLIISKQVEYSQHGRNNENILEDVYEAFIAAIYLDKGYLFAEQFIIKTIEKYVDFTDILLRDNNYKDQICRYFQQSFQIKPEYQHSKDKLQHICKIFHNGKCVAIGYGESKKKSEQDVSKKALIYFNVITEQ